MIDKTNEEKIQMALDALNDGWNATAKDILNSMIKNDSEPETPKKLFIVETVNLIRSDYAVEAVNKEEASQFVLKNLDDLEDGYLNFLTDKHMCHTVNSVTEVTAEDYLKFFDRENEDLKNIEASKKFALINRS